MKKKISKENRIFVAGANGMVGSAICRALNKAGYGDVNKNGGKILKPFRDELDLLDSESVKKWFRENKPDVVVIAAAKVGGILANSSMPLEFLLENTKIQNNIIETSWKSGVNRLLFLGSSCIYPKFCNQPIKEEYLLTGGLEPTNESYALAKILGIKLCSSLRKQYNFDSLSLMPTNLYGPRDNYHEKNSHVIPALIRKFYEAKINKKSKVICWGSGSPFREFLHVDDLGDACVFALENWDPSFNELDYLNVGTGKDISIKNLANLIAKQVGFEGSIEWDEGKPDGTPKKLLDITKISKLGWEPKINLEEGIRSTIECYKSEIPEKSKN